MPNPSLAPLGEGPIIWGAYAQSDGKEFHRLEGPATSIRVRVRVKVRREGPPIMTPDGKSTLRLAVTVTLNRVGRLR